MTQAPPMDDAEAQSTPSPSVELHRVAGEDTPTSIVGGLAALGVVLAALALASIGASRKAATIFDPPSLAQEVFARRRLEEALRAAEAASQPAPAAPVAAAAVPGQPCLPIVAAPFSRDSARPELAGLDAPLQPLLDWLRDHPEAVVLVEGHTDPTGAERHNVLLSYERAQVVGAWLQDKGVAKSRMTIRAAGALPPSAPAPVVADNRQALIMIEGAPRCSPGAGNDR